MMRLAHPRNHSGITRLEVYHHIPLLYKTQIVNYCYVKYMFPVHIINKVSQTYKLRWRLIHHDCNSVQWEDVYNLAIQVLSVVSWCDVGLCRLEADAQLELEWAVPLWLYWQQQWAVGPGLLGTEAALWQMPVEIYGGGSLGTRLCQWHWTCQVLYGPQVY